MNKTKIVKEVLLDYMQKKGYDYQYDQEMWIFEKQEEKLKKIIFVMDVHRQSIKFVFDTNAYGQMQIEGIDFVNKQKIRIDGLRCCAYTNEDDFRQIMYEIKRVIEEKGDEIFAKISEPTTEVIPTPELQKQLFDNHEELINKGKKILSIENRQGREKLEVLVEHLEGTRKTKTFQEFKDELVMLSAVYGEICREQSQGKWTYRKNIEACCIEGKMHMIMSPLNIVFGAWGDGDYYNLHQCYYSAESICKRLSN